ncbi:hypothetical protein BH20ACT3_BH20ACT3_03890 [soil metagenome]
MWIEVDPSHAGERSWVNPNLIERCDVNANPEPPWALLTLRSGSTATVSQVKAMQALQKVLGVDLPRAP